jgi:hypothetical protein
MATVLAMPTEAAEAANRKREALLHFNAIKKAGAFVRVNSLRIGFHGYALKKNNLFGMLGYATEREVWEAAEIGPSTWYAKTRLAEAFEGLDEEDFCAMKGENAEALADLPKSKRLSPKWYKKAATESIKEFAELVDEEIGDDARPSDGKEKTVSYTVKMPKSRKKAVEAGLQEISKELGCDGDESRALELLVAEKTGTPSLVGVITTAVQKLKQIKELCESGLSSDEVLEKVIPMNEEMILDFAAALDSLQTLESQ